MNATEFEATLIQIPVLAAKLTENHEVQNVRVWHTAPQAHGKNTVRIRFDEEQVSIFGLEGHCHSWACHFNPEAPTAVIVATLAAAVATD